jgi:inosine-uridine nucleoside N-ribohydrolase
VRAFPGAVTILALGPFTNLALAARLDDGFAAQAQELVIMGGSFNPHAPQIDEFALQFIHSPRVEFNSRWDPEAAHLMLHAGWKKITAVPTDATTATKLTPALVQRATAAPTPLAQYTARYAQPGFPMWDEVAAAIFLDPGLAQHTEKLAMDIDTNHSANYGATLSWPAGKGPGLGEPEVTAVLEIDVPRFEEIFVTLISARPALAGVVDPGPASARPATPAATPVSRAGP